MKYKRERRSKPKSKCSKLDRRKLKKFLKHRGISSLDAMAILNSTLTSRGKFCIFHQANIYICSLHSHKHFKLQPMVENIVRIDDPNRKNIFRTYPVRAKVMVIV